MVDLLETLAIGATAAIMLTAAGAALPVRLGYRLLLGAVAGAWIALVATLAANGVLAFPIAMPVLFATPLLSAAVLCAASPRVRAALLAIPVTLIVRLNILRVLGIGFLFLIASARLGGPFPYFAGIGDILTGLLAFGAAGVAARQGANDRRVLVWNALGMLDLVVAVTLGTISAPASPLQMIHIGAGSAAITTLPWALIPLALVPAYLIGHTIVFAQARAQERGAAIRGRANPGAAQNATAVTSAS
jgi:hypothetical protein